MSEPLFLRQARGLTLDEVATLTGATPVARSVGARRIADVASLDRAGPAHLTFFESRNYVDDAAATHAGACLTTEALAGHLPARTAALIVREPYRAFVMAARKLFPHALRPSSFVPAGTTAGAHIDPGARLEEDVTVEPGAVIGPGVEIGARTLIGANAVIGAGVRIGRDCSIGANSAIANALIGDRVIVHPGCMIGQDGFGYVMSGKGHLKAPQVGRVIIQDDVEIGAGTTIDRGAIRDTVIGEGSKIDNLVQVAHNVSIGRHCVVVGQCGIAGSSTLEDFVVLGARAGVSNNVTIGEGAQLAALSGAHSDLAAGGRYGGVPAKPMKQWIREMKAVTRIARAGDGAKAAADE